MSGLCVPSQSLKERFEWILFDEHMWLAVVLDHRCSMATKESWFHDFALNFARPAVSASSSASSASSSVLPLGIKFTTIASFFLRFATHNDAHSTLLEDIAVSSSAQSSLASSSNGVSASSSVSASAPVASRKRRGILLGMIALFMCLPSCIIIHLGDFWFVDKEEGSDDLMELKEASASSSSSPPPSKRPKLQSQDSEFLEMFDAFAEPSLCNQEETRSSIQQEASTWLKRSPQDGLTEAGISPQQINDPTSILLFWKKA
jgi:hypothetical protein